MDRYGFFGAGTDISAIHGPISDISKIFKSCFYFIVKNIMYCMPYLFFQKLQNSGFMS